MVIKRTVSLSAIQARSYRIAQDLGLSREEVLEELVAAHEELGIEVVGNGYQPALEKTTAA